MISRTTLITWIFLSPALARWTSKDVFSSSAGAAPPAAGAAAATATGAALTPELLLQSLYQLGQLKNRHVFDRLQNLFASHFVSSFHQYKTPEPGRESGRPCGTAAP